MLRFLMPRQYLDYISAVWWPLYNHLTKLSGKQRAATARTGTKQLPQKRGASGTAVQVWIFGWNGYSPVTNGYPAADQSLKPPAMLVTEVKPASSRISRPTWLRLPERQ